MDSLQKEIKVLLINPFLLLDGEFDLWKIKNRFWEINEPLGLYSIHSYIKKEMSNVCIEVYDANAEACNEILALNKVNMNTIYDGVKSKLKEFNPDIVGVSALFEFSGQDSLKFIDIVKEVDKSIVTIMGGAFATFSYKKAFKNNNLDYIIRREGEVSLKQFIEFKLGKREICDVGGLVYRRDLELNAETLMDDEFVINQDADLIDLSDIPIPERNEKLMDLYTQQSKSSITRYLGKDFDGKDASLFATRGCPFQCKFCSTQLMWGPSIRFREVSDIIDEIRMLKSKYGINLFTFVDDNITINSKFFIKLLTALKEEDIRWTGGGNIINTATAEIIKLMVDSGVVFISCNPESGSNNTLKSIRKPLKYEMTEKFVKLVKSVDPNIYLYASWVVGFPFETMEEVRETHQFAKSLDFDWSAFYCFTPYPGTKLYDDCITKGYINEDNSVSNSYTFNAISTENFSSAELTYENYLANIDLNFLNNKNMHSNTDRAISDFNDMIFTYPDHVFAYYCLSKCYAIKKDKDKADMYLQEAREAAKRDHFYLPFIKHFDLEGEILYFDLKKKST